MDIFERNGHGRIEAAATAARNTEAGTLRSDRQSLRAGLFLCALFCLFLAPAICQAQPDADAATVSAPKSGDDAVRAHGNVAPPKPATAPLSSVYGQDAASPLPTHGITVRENKPLDMQISDELDDYDEAPAAGIADPIEPWNRFWFGFNDIFYMYVANPAYKAWETVMPWEFRAGIGNFWNNLLFPMRFLNNLLQFRFMEAGVEFARFIANTSAGFGGFFNVAADKKSVVPVHPEGEDFGQTLGRWGIGHGFYIVWPFIGPSSVRETFGWAGDYFLYPGFALGYAWDVPWYAISGIQVGFFFNDLDDVLPTYIGLRDAAVDPYIMMREAWVRYRAIQVAR